MSMDNSRPEKDREAREGLNDGHLIEEYETRLAEMSELAGRVRHEINNPLTGLLGQTQLLLRENLSESARHRVQTIEQLAARIRDAAALLRQVQSRPPSSSSNTES